MLYVPITINIEDVKSFCSLKLSEVFDKIDDIYEDYESGLLNKNDAYMLARSYSANNATAEEIISKALRGYKG